MAKPIKYCSVEGCGRRCHTHGLCAGHDWRMRTWGNVGTEPLAPPKHVGPRANAKPALSLTCKGCGGEFKCSPSMAVDKDGTVRRAFCSQACRSLVLDKKPTFVCGFCGEVTLRRKGKRNKGYSYSQKFCSKGCADKALNTGGYIHHSGYRYIHVDGRKIYEHRHVMEQMLGRKMLAHETAHHKNGLRSDNRPENLELWSTRQCKGQRVEDKVAYALEILDTYPQIASLQLAKKGTSEVLIKSSEEEFEEISVYNTIRDIDGLI